MGVLKISFCFYKVMILFGELDINIIILEILMFLEDNSFSKFLIL